MKNTKIALAAFGALMVSTSMASAAGFYLQEQSVSAGGAAYAGAASNTKDASTIFFNPAGVTKLSGAQANLGVQIIAPIGSLDNEGSTFGGPLISGGDGGNPYNPTPLPSGYAAMPVSAVDGLWVGIGVSAPFGLAHKYDSDWFGRFDAIKTDLVTKDIQPTLAYKINDRISIGGGLNIQHADAELTNAANLGGTTGISKLSGDDWGVGYTLGTQIEILPTTTLGLNYRSSVHYDLDGRVTIQGTPGAGSQFSAEAEAAFVTPDIASIGLSHQVNDKWTVMGQANWMGWNNFNDITPIATGPGLPTTPPAVQQDYQTVWSYALGAEYAYSPEWTFRGGLQYDNTPTVDRSRSTRTPDGDRTWLATGATYQFSQNMSLDFNVTYIHIATEDINVSRNGGAAVVRAEGGGSVAIVGAALNYKF